MDFKPLTDYLDLLRFKGIPSCDLEVRRDHEIVYRHFSGESHPGTAMQGNETYWLFSASKLITMTAAMQLIERGLICLSDPVSKYLPAYARLTVRDAKSVRPAHTTMTIEHLMSMQSGLNYDLQSPGILECLKRYGDNATTRQLAEAFVDNPLDFEPGTHFQYSLSHDVIGAVIEVASGMSFGEYIRTNITDPLDIDTLTFHPTSAQLNRLAACYRWNERETPFPVDNHAPNYRLSAIHESGGAGLLGDVASYSRFADALANGGVGENGARILLQESIDQMRTDRLAGASRRDFDSLYRAGYSYALGVRTMVDNRYSRSPIGEFGWDGAAGAYVLIDPKNHISAFYAQHVRGCPRCYAEFHPAIRDMIYSSLSLC